MATLTVAEYENATANGTVIEPALVIQTALSTASVAVSEAFNSRTRFVMLSAVGGSIHFRFGTNPTGSPATTVTANCPLLAAGTPVVFAVTPGAALKVAGLTAA